MSPSCAVSSSEVMTVWAAAMRVRVVNMAAICRVRVFRSVFFVSVRGGGVIIHGVGVNDMWVF